MKYLQSTPSVVFAGFMILAFCHPKLYSQESDLTPGSSEEAVLVGAGDIAKCDMLDGAAATAWLLNKIPGTIFTVGDNAYESGSAEEFKKCYAPTWGRHRARTRPAPGNHDVKTNNGQPYYDYFGENAGPKGRGYYSYDLGSWHIISLNSESDTRANSPQGRWLQKDLKANPSECILAYWHKPRFSSGPHGNDRNLDDFWHMLYEAGAEIILNGHDHTYERFAPQNPKGRTDPERGIRQFVVGTGGGGVYRFEKLAPNSEIHNNSTYGVLKLTLGPGHYQWEFVPTSVGKFSDSGRGTCSPTH